MSTPHRFFTDKINYPETDEIYLDGEEFVHAQRVLRVAAGSEITLLDGSGNEYFAIVSKIEKSRLLALIVGVNAGEKEPNSDVLLLCGALKGDKTEFVVQKATELGVSKIGVFNSKFCSAYFNENKLERLNKVAREAAKQCLRSKTPQIFYFDNFESALASANGYENKIFACEFICSSQADISSISSSCAIVVGSEGGFCQEEFDLAVNKYSFKGITLGKRILRAETAAISLLSVVQYFLGELK